MRLPDLHPTNRVLRSFLRTLRCWVLRLRPSLIVVVVNPMPWQNGTDSFSMSSSSNNSSIFRQLSSSLIHPVLLVLPTAAYQQGDPQSVPIATSLAGQWGSSDAISSSSQIRLRTSSDSLQMQGPFLTTRTVTLQSSRRLRPYFDSKLQSFTIQFQQLLVQLIAAAPVISTCIGNPVWV